MTHDPNWWALGLLLTALGWNVVGVFLAAWRQPNDDCFFVSMILWASAPFWVWFLPFSRDLRQAVVSFWRGMDWIPPAENEVKP